MGYNARPWLLEKTVTHGQSKDSSYTIFVDIDGFGNLCERPLAIERDLSGYVESVDGVKTRAVVALLEIQYSVNRQVENEYTRKE